MTWSLVGIKDGRKYPYFDPFTSKTAIFDTKLQAQKVAFMLEMQNEEKFEVEEN